MKNLIVILAVLFCSNAFSQEWRDSLIEARKLYKNGDYEESVKYYQSAQRLAPETVDLSQEEGLSAFRARMYPEAEKLFSRAASRQKDFKKKSSAYNNEGYSRMQQQNYAGAEESFKNALRTNPNNEKARQNLAEAKRIRKKKEEEQKKNQDQQDQKDKQQQQDKEDQDGQSGKGDQQKQDKNGQSRQQADKQNDQQQGSSSGGDKNSKAQPKLGDKQTDRKLDELMRQEMGTKKRLDGTKNGGNGKAVKKDW